MLRMTDPERCRRGEGQGAWYQYTLVFRLEGAPDQLLEFYSLSDTFFSLQFNVVEFSNQFKRDERERAREREKEKEMREREKGDREERVEESRENPLQLYSLRAKQINCVYIRMFEYKIHRVEQNRCAL